MLNMQKIRSQHVRAAECWCLPLSLALVSATKKGRDYSKAHFHRDALGDTTTDTYN